LNNNAKSVSTLGPIGDIPLIILTAEKTAKKVKGWRDSQEQLKKWSSNSKHQMINNATHGTICYKYADSVVDEIMEIMTANALNISKF